MIASMTGFGKASFTNERIKIEIDIKSINSKQLDLMMRLPAVFREEENQLRNQLAPILERGKVELTVNLENLTGKTPVRINNEVLKSYKQQIYSLVTDLDVEMPQDIIPILLRLPESLMSQSEEAEEADRDILIEVAIQAANELLKSRRKEGEGLYHFFFEKVEKIRGLLLETEKYETNRVGKIREKLEMQLSRLQGVEIDRGRLEQELIYYIEKLDVSEEKQRLTSHLNYFEETLGEPDEENVGGKGKKLGFISQEIGREINTLGSKSNDAGMQQLVVMMKDELEQIKEQVLNVL